MSNSNKDNPREISSRIHTLSSKAEDRLSEFSTPDNLPDEQRALGFLTEGVGQAIKIYIDLHATDQDIRLSTTDQAKLENAMNTYLMLYAKCYGRDITPEFSIREAAEIFIDTHNIRDTAQILTQIPDTTH
ncbi:MAG: hypothetical protein ABEI06_06120 [Halobacteriaceae archaeon]